MKYYVYIIQSLVDNTYYKGFSLNPYERLEYHNQGESLYTSRKTPWKLVCILAFDTKKEALMHVPTKCRKREKLKKYSTISLVALINSNQNILNQI
ncbi:MAG: GIY-YIG nuclease family protein [Saprospiraceae bacterium]